MNKFSYLIRSMLQINKEKVCPFCNNKVIRVVDRKFIFTTLNECSNCYLYFRHPLDTIEFNKEFYQEDYKQSDGMTTDLPHKEELDLMLSKNFLGTAKDCTNKIKVLKHFLPGPTIKVIDYGANWGYTSFQFAKAGFEVQSYEISKPRAVFGKHLGISIYTEESLLNGDVDVFFNSHVIEHVPRIQNMFTIAKKLLNEGGFFIAYCPNGSDAFRLKYPKHFHKLWGQVHPNYINDKFLSTVFQGVPYLIGSDASREEDIMKWDKKTPKILDMSGSELFVFSKLNSKLLTQDK